VKKEKEEEGKGREGKGRERKASTKCSMKTSIRKAAFHRFSDKQFPINKTRRLGLLINYH
jgi:hypothetical protein